MEPGNGDTRSAGELAGEPIGDGLSRLLAVIQHYGRALVAFSGGADSALVARVAHDVLGDGALAVTGASPSLAALDHAEAHRVALAIGVRLADIETFEMENPAYRANAGDRCYHCKSELYGRLETLRERLGFEVVLDGTNLDDLGDTRPGLRAAREQRVVSPLVLAGIDKRAVRKLSRQLGLETWDKPANACLASRLPRGTPVSLDRLRRVEEAERSIRDLGFRQVRVRDEGARGRVELAGDELQAGLAPGTTARIEELVVGAGFETAWVDPAGYRQGGSDRDG